MRDLLYHGIWMALLPISLYSAHLGILLWIWVALLPPVDLMYGSLGMTLPFNKLAAAAVVFAMLTKTTAAERKFYFDFLIGIVSLYAIVVTLSYILAPAAAGATADGQYDKFWKELVLGLLITGLMHTRHRLHQVTLMVGVAFGFVMVKEAIIFLLTAGGHKVEGLGVTGDNNGLALAILMTIPLLLNVGKYTVDRWVRLAIYITAALGAVTVIASYSRGGFVGLVALGVMLLKGNKSKVRTIVAIAICGAILYALMPEDYLERVNTIKEATEDNSFMIRLVAWKVNFLMALDHPILGTGPYGSLAVANWFAYVGESATFLFPSPIIYRSYVAHSIYFQVLGDTGFLGLFLFLSMLLTALILTIRTQRLARKDPSLLWAADLARATQISLVMYMVCGAALSLVYFEVLYILLAVISRNHRTVAELTAAQRAPARVAMRPNLVPAYRRAL